MNVRRLATLVLMTVLVVTLSGSSALAEGATIKGKVNWEGKPYRPKKMKGLNPECVGFHGGAENLPRKESILTNENSTLRNVYLYIKNAPKSNAAVPTTPVVLDQKGCIYSPHVIGVQVGQKIQITNSDPTAHNVHFTPKRNPEFNKSQPKKGLVDTMVFKRKEIMVPVKCDVHPWMYAFVGVTDHPFFDVTGTDGMFTITGLPPGTYTVEAWHEKYGKKTIEVTVAQDETKTADFTYSRKDKKKR